MDDRLITVAIHTYERAVELKSLLESEGVKSSLQNVNLTNPTVASGVRVRIREKDLPLALRIIENAEIFITKPLLSKGTEVNGTILVPVDFSSHSDKACRLAFQIASAHKADIVLLHSFVDPSVTGTLQLSDALDYDVTATEMREQLMKEAESRLNSLAEELRGEIKEGSLPPVKFSHEIVEGVPEDAINEYSKANKPMLIVMGTRGSETKERELVGSVTAEVLDTCRVPVFTVPDTLEISRVDTLRHIAMFCSLDQEDMLALDSLTRIIDHEHISVTLLNIPTKKQRMDIGAPMDALLRYCREHYPAYDFDTDRLSHKKIESDFRAAITRHKIDLIAVPNRKKNVFARLFNPGIAHRLLFQSDIPMLVVPV